MWKIAGPVLRISFLNFTFYNFLIIAELFKFVGFFTGRVLSKYTRTGPLLLFTGERKADRMNFSKFAATLPS